MESQLCEIARSAEVDNLLVDQFSVPWTTSHHGRAKFQHKFYMVKAPTPDGKGYMPSLQDGVVQYHTERPSSSMSSNDCNYPLPLYVRRLSMNKWRQMIAFMLVNAGGRFSSLQANLSFIFLLFDNELFADVPRFLILLQCVLFAVGIMSWIYLSLKASVANRTFYHDDTRMQKLICIISATIGSMFAVPNDVILLPFHLLPADKGGLLLDSTYVQGNRKWPVHTIVHQHEEDHDYVNMTGLSVQLPLFFLVDIGCTACNLIISFKANVFNYALILQLACSMTITFAKIYQALRRMRVERRLLAIWRKTAADHHVTKGLKKSAVRKYLAAGGSWRKLVDELQSSGYELEKEFERSGAFTWTIVRSDPDYCSETPIFTSLTSEAAAASAANSEDSKAKDSSNNGARQSVSSEQAKPEGRLSTRSAQSLPTMVNVPSSRRDSKISNRSFLASPRLSTSASHLAQFLKGSASFARSGSSHADALGMDEETFASAYSSASSSKDSNSLEVPNARKTTSGAAAASRKTTPASIVSLVVPGCPQPSPSMTSIASPEGSHTPSIASPPPGSECGADAVLADQIDAALLLEPDSPTSPLPIGTGTSFVRQTSGSKYSADSPQGLTRIKPGAASASSTGKDPSVLGKKTPGCLGSPLLSALEGGESRFGSFPPLDLDARVQSDSSLPAGENWAPTQSQSSLASNVSPTPTKEKNASDPSQDFSRRSSASDSRRSSQKSSLSGADAAAGAIPTDGSFTPMQDTTALQDLCAGYDRSSGQQPSTSNSFGSVAPPAAEPVVSTGRIHAESTDTRRVSRGAIILHDGDSPASHSPEGHAAEAPPLPPVPPPPPPEDPPALGAHGARSSAQPATGTNAQLQDASASNARNTY